MNKGWKARSGVAQDAGRLVTVVLRGVEGAVEAEGRGGGLAREGGGAGGEPPKREEERRRVALGGWLVMHCANSPRRGHVTRIPGLSLIAPRRNVGHTVPTKHCTLHLTSGFPRRILAGQAGVAFHQPRPRANQLILRGVLPCEHSTSSFLGFTLLLRRRVFQSDLSRQRRRKE